MNFISRIWPRFQDQRQNTSYKIHPVDCAMFNLSSTLPRRAHARPNTVMLRGLCHRILQPKLHKSPYKHRFIAGSSKSTTKDLSCLLTKVLSTIKDGLVRYCNTKTSCNGVNNMWILKNSTSLLSSLDQLDVRTATSVQTFDFSKLYTSISHDLLKSRISNPVHNAFRKKDGNVRYTHIKVTRAKGYFTHDINGSGDNMYTADNICKMI